jgi:hypothetical protein
MMTCDIGILSPLFLILITPFRVKPLRSPKPFKNHNTMFAVTTTTNVASTAKTRFSGTKKTTSSSRKSFSSISVKASSKSSEEEKFDRREMLKNALVASVATVVATPKPVRANESSSY